MKNAKKEQASWGGRFSKGPSRLMLRFSESVSFEKKSRLKSYPGSRKF